MIHNFFSTKIAVQIEVVVVQYLYASYPSQVKSRSDCRPSSNQVSPGCSPGVAAPIQGSMIASGLFKHPIMYQN